MLSEIKDINELCLNKNQIEKIINNSTNQSTKFFYLYDHLEMYIYFRNGIR